MKVISLLQPWASLVVLGHKKIETRSRNTKYRGPLLIHASKKGMLNWMKELVNKWIFPNNPNLQFTLGHIIGKVELVETFRFTDSLPQSFEPGINRPWWSLTEQELAFGDYSPGRYGWLLANPVMFDNPIPAKGKLGIWNYEPEFHVEKIICPECSSLQTAVVEHTIPFFSYVHTCSNCKYMILESEWQQYDLQSV